MSEQKNFYLTTPIYFCNANLHIGHCYTTIIADVIARYKKMRGYNVKFLTGTDEHGQKIEISAKKNNMQPQDFVDEIVTQIKDLWNLLDIDYDIFMRTTDPKHISAVQKIFKKLYDSGDIYIESKASITDEHIFPDIEPGSMVLIVNENMIIQDDLKIIKKANFSEINNIKIILKEIIDIPKEDRYKIIQKDCEQLQKGSIIFWIRDLLYQLKKVFINNKNKERVGEGYGMEFSYQLISKSFTKLNQKKIQSILQNSYHKLFIFNLNTIFTNLNANTEKKNIDNKFDINNISISDSYMDYNKKVTNILNNLSQDKNNIICLFSYDSKNIFNEINLNPINFYFVAEDGLIIKPINEINFKNVINIDNNWKSPIKTLFKNFINKTGCGNISVKEFSISLKYKDIGKGDFLLVNELKFLVENFLDKKKFDIILEKNNLEVKIKEANNFKYNYINEIIKSDKNIKFIFALNTIDKKADEFFDFLNNKKRCINDNMENINLITAIIGRKNSKAYYYLKDLNDFINIFDLQKI